jgi:syntaxin-binding protein 5
VLLRPVSVDETGDYIEWSRNQCGIKQAHLGTLFSLRRQSMYKDPRVELIVNKKALPYQPQPVSMGPASLYSQMISYVGGQSATGDQIDLLCMSPFLVGFCRSFSFDSSGWT